LSSVGKMAGSISTVSGLRIWGAVGEWPTGAAYLSCPDADSAIVTLTVCGSR
jgi:hypothetical protein